MVSSFDELMQVQAAVTVAVLQAHHSSWNNQYVVLPHDTQEVSGVSWDGSIKYHPLDVIEPLREMFDRAGQQHDSETLDRYREALRTVFHENIHLLAGPGTSLAFPLDAYEGKAHRTFEEAVTERATQNELNNFITRLGLEQVAPRISGAQAGAYGAYVPAVDSFSAAVGADVGLDADEVIRRMAVVNSAQKFPVAAELLYSKHLSELVPETAKADAIRRIAEAMHAPLATVHDYNSKDPSDVAISALAGRSAFRQASAEVEKIAAEWSGNQDLRRTLDAGLGATTPLHKPRRDDHAAEGPHTNGGDSPHRPSWNAKPADRRPTPGPSRSPGD
ncbi:hypothetical protein [Kribbella jiaozuonensis]|uniref:Uncharacterized protein n=1 Tax=Kribbella jiaozuonensis TaxID=2575441 RepID=A0A4U3LTF4_9ACTN|nr:hypothetical protein [Kribbella jiaozuonensis]TKK77787.1 hypothetical protein FDA38_21915 [Kribbella jiaozuonensis]